jgi:cysteine desulfurase family protein (TIGR01976 family)
MLTATVGAAVDFAPFRRQFPALAREFNGHACAFLDNPAGTQVPQDAIDRLCDFWTTSNANLGGYFRTSRESTRLFDETHAAMADMLGAASPDEIIIGQNMTTLTFAISRAIARGLVAGDEIVVTNLDHDGNVAPWRALEERGVVIRVVDINADDCTLDMADLASKIGSRTRVVAVTHCSNLVGTVVDVAEVCRMARAVGAISYIDAVQYAAHGTIDVQALDCDFLVCSSYKFFGPHLGILYGKRARLDALAPYKVRPADDVPPGRFETGTLNFEGCAALLGTFDYFQRVGRAAGPATTSRRALVTQALNAFHAREQQLGRRLIEGLQRIPGVHIWGITDTNRLAERVPTVSFTKDGLHPDAIAELLGEQEIYVWSGNNYALSLTERLGLEQSGGMVRVGPVHYNTEEEIDRLLQHVEALRG